VKTERNRYRIAILVAFGVLMLVLTLMVTNLFAQLRNLSVADNENMQWTISQLDTEFANLHARLSEELLAKRRNPVEVQLRVDIALSRLSILNSGRAAELFAGSESAAERLARANAYARQVVEISDRPGPLTDAQIEDLLSLTKNIRPDVRQISVIGLGRGADAAQQRRADFSRQLIRTAGIAIALLVLMGGLLAVLDRLLERAARRDSALLASSRQLASTVAASLDAIVTADGSGKITGFNAAAEEVFGWRRDEILGQTIEETFLPPTVFGAEKDKMSRFLDVETSRFVDVGRIELSARRKTGEEFPVELNITTAEDHAGTKFIAYIRDISERKINERKLIEARDRAERTDKAKSQFLAVMSHEMRTPLNGILGVLDLLKTTALTSRQQRYAKIATASSEILLEHINEALDITRIETGALHLTPQDFDLGELVANLVDVLEPLAREKSLQLSLNIEDGMRGCFHGDNNRIRQILTNLIGNAIKFTDEGHITLSVTGIHGPVLSSLRFDVADTGAGIAPEHQEQVFEDFVALAHGDERQSRGDGLGLSISRKIARQMGGDISLESARGQGSTFSLTVPLQRRAAIAGRGTEASDTGILPTCDVLIVEDNAINRSVLADMLTAKGHRVAEAVNGLDGLEKAAMQRFDIIFMDISMPVMDGIQATRELRLSTGPNAHTHIVGLTAHGREEYRDAAKDAGMNRFYNKPIRLESLEGIVADLTASDMGLRAANAPKDVIQELMDSLGAEALAGVGARFFDELAAFAAAARMGQYEGKPEALAEAAHKIKGAASMLGQTALFEPLEVLEAEARAGDVKELERRIAEIEALGATCQEAFEHALKGQDAMAS
jgi:PAS domain S-box-containing protein